MKICMILKRTFQQLKRDSRVLKEARSLTGRGYSVSVVILGDKLSKSYEKLHGIDVRIAKINDFNNTLKKFNPFKTRFSIAVILPKTIIWTALFGIREIQYFFGTLRMLLHENADVYHIHDFETLLLGYIAARMRKVKFIYDSHELWMESKIFTLVQKKIKIGIFKKIFAGMEHFLIKRADKVITVNESIAKIFADRYQIEKPVVISNFSEYCYVEASNILREKLVLNERHKIVLYHGNISEGRGLEKLVESSKHLNENVIIVIMGYGDLKSKLREKIKVENLSGVKILDAVLLDALINYVASADIGVVPIQNVCLSYYYSTPNKIWECIMAGIPFAVSNFPEMRRLAIDENMGVVFDPADSINIAKAIKELLDPNVYALKRKNVLEAKKRYNWKKERLKLIKLYAELDHNFLFRFKNKEK